MTKPLSRLLVFIIGLLLISALAVGTPLPQTEKGHPRPESKQEGFKDPSSNPSLAAAGGVEPLTPEELQAFFPPTLAQMPRTEISGKTGSVGPGKMSFADATFAVSEEKHIRVNFFDRGGFPPSTNRPLPVPAKGETAKHLNYTVEGIVVGRFPAAQMQEGPVRKIQVTVGRVRITLMGIGVEFSELAEAAATLPLAEIAKKASGQAAPPPETPKN